MKKSIILCFALLSAILALSFASCGGNDTPPPPKDHTLTDLSVFTANGGKFNGNVTIQNSLTGVPRENSASVMFSRNGNDLSMLISPPNELGLVTCSKFMESGDKSKIWFDITAPIATFTGGDVPTYYKDWYNIYTVTKINVKSYKFSDVKYDAASKILSFVCTATVDVFAKNNITGAEEIASSPSVVYTFKNLKK